MCHLRSADLQPQRLIKLQFRDRLCICTRSTQASSTCAPRNTSPDRPRATTPSSAHRCICTCAFSAAPKASPYAALFRIEPSVYKQFTQTLPETEYCKSFKQYSGHKFCRFLLDMGFEAGGRGENNGNYRLLVLLISKKSSHYAVFGRKRGGLRIG